MSNERALRFPERKVDGAPRSDYDAQRMRSIAEGYFPTDVSSVKLFWKDCVREVVFIRAR